MRVAYITAGAAGTVCGNCLSDNALAAALMRLGHDVVLLPAYTPVLTDEADVSYGRIVFGGVNLYLQAKLPLLRSTGLLDWLLDSPRLLRWVSNFAVDTDPANLGAMTQDMFAGESGPYRREMRKLVRVLRTIRPQVVHLTNSMLASMAGPVRSELGIPVVCSLQGEGDFLNRLPEPHRAACYEWLGRHARHIDRFVAPCDDQTRAMAPHLGTAARRVDKVLPGISVEGFKRGKRRTDGPFVVGFLARISPEKGLALLAEAVERLRAAHPDREIRLRVAGWRAEAAREYVDGLKARYGLEDLGYLSREDKFEFLAGLDAFAVPTAYAASKGLYVLEALAAGVPVVQPRIGAFPELVEATGGGYLCEAGDSRDLAAQLGRLLRDPEGARRMGARGRRAVLERFHTGRMAAETATVYERVLSVDGAE